MKKILLCEDVFEKFGLIIRSYCFECPYCGRETPRGGKAEGFRKAGMSHHVFACWEIGLFLRGYTIGKYTTRGRHGQVAMPIETTRAETWGPKFIKSIKANIRKREKDGVLDRLRP